MNPESTPTVPKRAVEKPRLICPAGRYHALRALPKLPASKIRKRPSPRPTLRQSRIRKGAPNRTLPKRCWLSACRVNAVTQRYHSPNVFTRKTSSEPSRDHSSDGRSGRPGRWAKNPQCILAPCQRMSRSSTDSAQCALLCVGGSM